MSSSVDTRIVEMKFDNAAFQRGVDQTLNSLKTLDKSLQMEGATKGLGEVDKAARNLSLQSIADGVQNISSKFTAMTAVALTALTNITNRAVDAGLQLAKSLTIAPIKQGFQEYETQLNSIQTILANTQAAGTNLKDVNGVLNELNTYADKTIYNFSEMTRNIGTFTAAGVDLKTATGSIKGIANLAALSGSNSQQASTAMYQLSQAISAGRVSLQDWNSVVNAGMGGTVFQRALAQTAERMGTLDKGAVKLSGKMKNATINGKSFRESITAKPGEESWLTSEVLTKTLEQFTGDMTDAELAAEGFSKAQIKAIQDQAKTAEEAATVVKTGTQLIDTLQEAVGSGWAQTWQTVIGDFNESKKLWTGISNELGNIIGKQAAARNKMLAEWKKSGGRTAVLDGIANIWRGLLNIIKPIQEAFREIFPPMTGKHLADISKAFRDLTENFKIGYDTADRLKRIFKGVFAVFDILFTVVKEVGGVLFDLFGVASGGSGSFLELVARVGDFIVKLRDAIKNGEGLHNFFEGLSKVIQKPLEWLGALGKKLVDLFDNLDFSAFDGLGKKMGPMNSFGQAISSIWEKTLGILDNVAKVFGPLADKFGDFFGDFGSTVSSAIGEIDFGKVLDLIQTGLLGGALVLLKKFLGSADDAIEVVKSWRETFTGPFDAMTETLGTMQNTLKAATLLQIAAAIGILAASAVALSTVDEEGLKRALVALTTMLIQLTGAMAVFQKIDIKSGMGQLILLAIALRILTSSVKALAELDWEDLAKGLLGTSVLLGTLVATARTMPDGKSMISSSIGLAVMAGAVKLLASAVTDLSGLSWEEMARGLVGVGALLGSLALFAKLTAANKGGVAQGAGLILLATGIKILASAMEDFAGFSWDEIGRGLAAMGGGMAIVAGALKLIPPSSVFSAAGVLVVAASLGMIGDAISSMGNLKGETIAKGLTAMAVGLGLIAGALALLPPTSLLSAAAIFIVASSLSMIGEALTVMGGMSVAEIAKGLITLAASLGIIAVALYAMTGTLAGAAALIIAAGALALLGPVLVAFGEMSLAEIGKGLLMLAGVFVVLGLAGLVLTPIVPTLLGLGIAVGLLGVGMLAAGAGVLAFSVGLTALAAAGAGATAAIVAIVSGLIGLIPTVMEQIGLGLVAFAGVIAQSGPAILGAITAVLNALLDAIIKILPKLGSTVLKIVSTILRVLTQAIPQMVSAGLRIVTGILQGIANNIGRIVTAASNIIVNFLDGISKNLPRIIDSGIKLIIAFVNGLAKGIRDNSAQMNDAGMNLAGAIVDGMTSGIRNGISAVTSAAKNLAKNALDAAKNFLGIHSPSREFAKLGKFSALGYAQGLKGNSKQIANAHSVLRSELSATMKAASKDISEAKTKLAKLTAARHKDTKAINATKKALAQARSEYARSSSALKMVNTWGDETLRLRKYANQLDSLGKKIDDANKKLADAKKARDDFAKSTTDQFDNLPSISDDTKLTDYLDSLRKQVTDTQLFTSQLAELRKRGLNDEAYKQLLSKGVSAMPFAQQILEGGQNSVDELNTLGSALSKSASSLGNSASKALYQAAVDSAAGLVKGLQAQQKNIEKQMDKLADAMVRAIKKKLGIKSPSREFMKVGNWSAQGVAEGLQKSKEPIEAAEKVGMNAIDAMRKTITGLSDSVSMELDTNPHIRPVLDLSNVEKNAARINRILTTNPLKVDGAYSAATLAKLEHQANLNALADLANAQAQPVGNDVSFVQNNYSPKALSNAEIYRNTNNQLSVAKGALTKK